MNPTGILLIVAGIWVGTQILGGDALGRLKLIQANPPSTLGAAGQGIVQGIGSAGWPIGLPGPGIAGGLAGGGL